MNWVHMIPSLSRLIGKNYSEELSVEVSWFQDAEWLNQLIVGRNRCPYVQDLLLIITMFR